MDLPRRSSRSPRAGRSARSRYTFALFIVTALALLLLDLPGTGALQPARDVVGTVFSPFRKVGDFVSRPFVNGAHGVTDYDDLKKENGRLKARLADQRGERAEIDKLERQVEELERNAGINVTDLRTITAEVTSGPVSNFDTTLEINRGTGDGVKDGMAVITGLRSSSGGGVLGRVTDPQSGHSRVELITSPQFEVGVRIVSAAGDRTGSTTTTSTTSTTTPQGSTTTVPTPDERGGLTVVTTGVLQGQGEGRRPQIDGIPRDANVKPGDIVYTSGFEESQFPRDLVVGRVTRVRRAANNLSQVVEVEPLADPGSLYVRVVLKDPPR